MQQAKVKVSVLCPGFVNTNIATSDRNRPTQLQPGEQQFSESEMAFASMMFAGIAVGDTTGGSGGESLCRNSERTVLHFLASGISDGSSYADGNDFRTAESGAIVANWADTEQRIGNGGESMKHLLMVVSCVFC